MATTNLPQNGHDIFTKWGATYGHRAWLPHTIPRSCTELARSSSQAVKETKKKKKGNERSPVQAVRCVGTADRARLVRACVESSADCHCLKISLLPRRG
jgi:hypothetical protein